MYPEFEVKGTTDWDAVQKKFEETKVDHRNFDKNPDEYVKNHKLDEVQMDIDLDLFQEEGDLHQKSSQEAQAMLYTEDLTQKIKRTMKEPKVLELAQEDQKPTVMATRSNSFMLIQDEEPEVSA